MTSEQIITAASVDSKGRGPLSRQGNGGDANEPRLWISAEARCVQSAEGGVVFCARTGRVFRLNRTGAVIWQGLCENKPVSEIAWDFEMAAEQHTTIVRAIQLFLGTLKDLGLVAAKEVS